MALKPVDTAIVMVVGPAIDDTDFKTVEEAIAYDAAGMDVSLIVEKTDGTTAVTAITLTNAGVNDWVHVDGGKYSVEITAAQNTEEGIGHVRGICTGVLVFESPMYDIVKANVYDSWVKGTDVLQTDVTQLAGVAQSLTDLKDLADTGYDPVNHKIQSDLIYIHGSSLTETDGQLAAAFTKLFDVATPLLVASDVMRGTEDAALATALATAQEDLDNPSQYMADISALATAASLSTHDGKLDAMDLLVDTLLTRITAARAGYLDNLSAGAVALAATALTDATWTDAKAAFLDHSIETVDGNVDTLLTRITAAVALASICTETRLAELDAANLPTDVANVKAKTDNLPSGIAKNVALSNFAFYMVLTSDHVTAATGKIVTGQISKDGSAFVAVTNVISEIGSGMYKVDLTQAEINADVILLKFNETDCDQRIIPVYTT